MSLRKGARLGHYQIVELIGAGGMGEVYKARDPRLNRTVAVKVLLEHISDRPEARARFEREAQTIAGLNHPHICVVYDIGREDKIDFLVMELLEGETLARRLERGPLPLAEALKHAAEIADALDKAHRHGVTHRDLKPGNVMLTRSGVKLLDFGLAKLRQSPSLSGLSSAATKSDMTAEGTILGSLQYMAPEQLEGDEVDARTDIFAFGAVVHEMITGRKAFEGKSAVSVMSSILKDPPKPASALQPASSAALDRLIATCLAKDPENRWQSARDICRELGWIADTSSAAAATPSELKPAARGRRTVSWITAGGFAVIVMLATGAAVSLMNGMAPAGLAKVAHLSVTLQPAETLASELGPPLALSPDGSMIAYSTQEPGGVRQLYLRPIDSPEAKAVPGSDGGFDPFFSPNGEWLGFFSQGKLKKVRVTGGSVETLCDAGSGRGGSWAADDAIYFAPANTTGLWRVSAAGGAPMEISALDRNKGEVSHRFPQVLPGGKALLLTVWTGPGWDEAQVQLLTLQTGERRTVAQGARIGRYAASGHLVYSRNGTDTLMAVPFDLGRLQVGSSPPVTLAERVIDSSESGEFAISDSGTLAYVAGNPQRYEYRLVWVDRSGAVEPLPAPPLAYAEPAISPDGRQVAVSIAGPAFGISVLDLARPTLTPLNAPGSSQAPVWTPDGKRVVYRATRKGFRNIFWRAADGSGDEERLTEGNNLQTPGAWTSDGKHFLFQDTDRLKGSDVWALSVDSDPKQQALLKGSFSEGNPHLSPNNRWLAYVSDESGRSEIWVRPFPKLDGKWKVSTEGGTELVWARNGRELFYRAGDKMMSVQIADSPAFSASSPRVVFESHYAFSMTGVSAYDVSPDGRFLMVQPSPAAQAPNQFQVVINWFSELRQRLPVK